MAHYQFTHYIAVKNEKGIIEKVFGFFKSVDAALERKTNLPAGALIIDADTGNVVA